MAWGQNGRNSRSPVNVLCEERVVLDFLSPAVAQALVRVALEKTSNETPCFGVHLVWEAKRVTQNALVHRVDVLVVEGRKASLRTQHY